MGFFTRITGIDELDRVQQQVKAAFESASFVTLKGKRISFKRPLPLHLKFIPRRTGISELDRVQDRLAAAVNSGKPSNFVVRLTGNSELDRVQAEIKKATG